MSFQCFLPATSSRANALIEAIRSSRRKKMNNVLFKIDVTNTLCRSLGERIFLDMATSFRISCVTRSVDNTNGQQLLTFIKLIALNKDDRAPLYK
ncbi:unnamed protein product [Rotaria sp. Silwood2]|nr:unnamed protein product [Rotaria sp. Silwood2]CAF2868555.1 unnamed protein product [Rotaria sp. Silwood2]CAF3018328.1 unnamed protein product [Rotaria sp. Silwood2]CAF3353133.1 unnamed protein product [Rotaria sp. Silwood2]CAF4205836.1 unnamed protein product [Rotaria sp. Silwood2]